MDSTTSSGATVSPLLSGEPVVKGCLRVDLPGVAALEHAWEVAPSGTGPWAPVPGAHDAELPLLPGLGGRWVRAVVTAAGARHPSEPLLVVGNAGNPGTDWMHAAGYGVCHHFLAEFVNRVAADDRERWRENEGWDDLLDTFDVAAYAADVRSTGAGFVILTLGQNSGYLLAPNATYEDIGGLEPGQRTPSRRDLVSEIGTALADAGIRLLLYIPANPPHSAHLAPDDYAITDSFGQARGQDGLPSQQTMGMWQAVVRDYSERYGDRLAGWWFDGVFPEQLPAYDDLARRYNWYSLTAAAKAGSSSRVVTYNRGVGLFAADNPWLDYTSGEINEIGPLPDGRWADDDETIQWFALTYLGEHDPTYAGWGNRGTSHETGDLVRWVSESVERGGVVCLDTKLNRFGRLDAEQLAQLGAVAEAVHGMPRHP